MAKKVKGATITFEVTDDGTLKQVGRRAQTASKGVDKLGKSAGDTRRNLQSMSGRTESASKSFSRLQQGTGGLVQSYAILASTVFAVTAAFRALEQAQNIQQQIKGFEQLTKITGTSMLTITNRVREAANGLLDFQTAAQQTAIATAAGFTADQIEGLTVGAKNASVALGRDMTDSFNRLIRGVTKAEPELLDELGIILRLDIATRNYAASIGASADKLTIAQRRAAVYNEVQKQLNDNFGAIGEDANSLTNQISAFTTSLTDIGIAVSGTILPAINAFISFLDRNKIILFGILGIFALRLTNDIMPGLSKVGKATEDWVSNSQQRIKDLNKELGGNAKRYKQLENNNKRVDKQVSKSFKQSLAKRGVSEKEFFKKSAANQKRSITAHINALKKQEKNTGKSMQRQIAIQRAAYKKIEMIAKQSGKKIGLSIEAGAIQAERGLLRLKLKGQTYLAGLAKSASALGPILRSLGVAANFLLGAFMAFSFLTMFIDMIPGVARAKEAVQDLSDRLDDGKESAGELNNAINGFHTQKLKAIGDAIREGVNPMLEMAKAVQHLSNILAGTNIKEMGADVVDTVEKGIIDAGFMDGKANKIASDVIMMKMVEALQMAEVTGFDASGALTGIAETARIRQLYNDEGRHLSDENIAERVSMILEEAKAMRIHDKDTTQYAQALENITDHYRYLGLAAEDYMVKEKENGKTVINSSAALDLFFKTIGDGVQGTKTLVQSISDMDKPLDDLVESLKLSLPKPNEFGKIGSALDKVFNQYDAAMKAINDGGANQKIILQQLSEEEQKIVEEKGLSLDIDKVATTLLMIKLKLTEEEAQKILDNREVLLKNYDTLNKNRKLQKQFANMLKVELMIQNQLKDSHTQRVVATMKLNDLTRQRRELVLEIETREVRILKLEEDQRDTYREKTNELITQKTIMDAQLTVMENQLDNFFQMKKLFVETFDSNVNTALTDIIDGGSGKEAIKKMAESMKKDVSGFVSGIITEKATGGLKKLLGFEDKAKLTPEAQAIKKVHDEHVTELSKALTAHASAFGKTMTIDDSPIDQVKEKVKNKVTGEEEGGGLLGKIGKFLFGTKGSNDVVDNVMTPMEGVEEITTKHTPSTPGLFGTHGGTDLFNIKDSMIKIFGPDGVFMQTGKNLFGGKESVFGKLGTSLFGEGGAFSKLFSGEKGGIMGGLGKMFGGGAKAGGGFLSSIFGGGGGGGGIMALLKPLLSMIPGIGPLLSILPFAKGGIIGNKLVGLAQGGVMPRYAKGGVATQPTYLVGEGKQNEAVVPLPDNRSIPVDLGRGAGNENNVSINVNMATGKTDTKADAQEGKQLGAAINAAVLNEIERQQRPGGMLAQG